jgi:D-amino-acid oxidase
MAAGAMWGPYLVKPVDRVRRWSERSLTVFRELAQNPESGVRLGSGIEASRVPVEPPTWGSELEGFRMCEPSELPEGFATGWRFTVPLIDMPTYLGYLQRRLATAGGLIEQRRLDSLDEATSTAPMVVNCTGMGSKDLVPDPTMYPIRGQLVVVANPGIEDFFSEDTGLSPDLLHYCPHGETVVLGGQAAADDLRAAPDLDLAKAIVARCAAIEPRLAGTPILGHRVGFRPTRPMVRVEAEQRGDTVIMHNYGHGGAG